MRFHKIKIRFIKIVVLIKLVYFGGNDCLLLGLKDYKKSVLKSLYNFVLRI